MDMNQLSALTERRIYANGFLALVGLIIIFLLVGYFREKKPAFREFNVFKYDNFDHMTFAYNELLTNFNQLGVVTIYDLYFINNYPSTFQDTQYGWTDLSTAHVIKRNGKYIICLPKAHKILGGYFNGKERY